ncbi:MAG: phosphoglycerate mutase [Deltaproteobacteria bacterium]|nr:phosphoglycerate mutase [Deltaproteobacteria bacterium]
MPSPAPRKCCLLILLDGLADRAQPLLGGLTPLQYAATPHLDALAARGANGHWHAAQVGQALPSETAHYLMMGYGLEEFPGRGWLEALGLGLTPADGQVFILARLAAAEPLAAGGFQVRERFPRLAPDEAAEFYQAVAAFESPAGTARFHPTKRGQGVLALSGPGLTPWVTDSDPLCEDAPWLAPGPWAGWEDDPATGRTLELLSGYLAACHARLAGHPLNQARRAAGLAPVNAVLTHRPGAPGRAPSLAERWGLRVLSISSSALYQGVFLSLGAEAQLLPQDPDPAADMAGKLKLALARAADSDLIHLHTKLPDEMGHAGDPRGKARALEALDRGLAGLAGALAQRPELVVAVTGDHATPSSGGGGLTGTLIHSGEASPLILAGQGVWQDGVSRFDEVAAAGGALHLLRGPELMLLILNYLDRAKLQGLRDDPQDLPFYPGPARQLFLT